MQRAEQGPAPSSGQRCCCCSAECRDALRNGLAALAGVFGSLSESLSLFVGCFVVHGLGLFSAHPVWCLHDTWRGFLQNEFSLFWTCCRRCCILKFNVVIHFALTQTWGPLSLVLQQQQQQLTQVSTIMSSTMKMKPKMMKKAPSCKGWALGRCCSFSQMLFRRPSVSSLASILVRALCESLLVPHPSPDYGSEIRRKHAEHLFPGRSYLSSLFLGVCLLSRGGLITPSLRLSASLS